MIFYFILCFWGNLTEFAHFPLTKILSQMAKFCHTKKVADVGWINIFPIIPECKYLDKYIHYPINNFFSNTHFITLWCFYLFLSFCQFFDVAQVVIVHEYIWPILVILNI